MRVLSGVVAFVLVAAALSFPLSASAANTSPTEAEAYQVCLKWMQVNWGSSYPNRDCLLSHDPAVSFVGSACPSSYADGHYFPSFDGSSTENEKNSWYGWCVPAECAGDWGNTTTGFSMELGAPKDPADDRGCCVSWVQTATWNFDGIAGEDGYYKRTGGYCAHNYGAHPEQPGPDRHKKFCDGSHVSCYSPQDHHVCYGTESGEQVCSDVGGPPPDNCVVGATGAACAGSPGDPPPSPPDPPIPPDSPPNNTDQVTHTNNQTNITNQTTINNYSGTSTGGSGDESGPPGSGGDPGAPGGGQTNTNGGGNSGQKGTDDAGKCPDGSVPTASGCSGTAVDNGCNAPPQAYGDAVLAESFKELVAIRCAVQAASGSSVGDVPDMGDPMDGSGDPSASSVSSDVDAGEAANDLDAGGFGFSASCPLQDIHVSVMGSAVDIPLADKCDLLSYLRYVVLAMAYFAAAKIIAGVK